MSTEWLFFRTQNLTKNIYALNTKYWVCLERQIAIYTWAIFTNFLLAERPVTSRIFMMFAILNFKMAGKELQNNTIAYISTNKRIFGNFYFLNCFFRRILVIYQVKFFKLRVLFSLRWFTGNQLAQRVMSIDKNVTWFFF